MNVYLPNTLRSSDEIQLVVKRITLRCVFACCDLQTCWWFYPNTTLAPIGLFPSAHQSVFPKQLHGCARFGREKACFQMQQASKWQVTEDFTNRGNCSCVSSYQNSGILYYLECNLLTLTFMAFEGCLKFKVLLKFSQNS